MLIHDNTLHLPLIRHGMDVEDSSPDGQYSEIPITLTDDGIVRLSLPGAVPDRQLIVVGHPAVGQPSQRTQIRSRACSTVLEVVQGSLSGVIWDVRDHREDPTHLLHRVVPPARIGEGEDLVTTSVRVRVQGGAVFMVGTQSRINSSLFRAGEYSSISSVCGPAVALSTTIEVARPDYRSSRVAVPLGLEAPEPSLATRFHRHVLWGIIATTYPSWRDLLG